MVAAAATSMLWQATQTTTMQPHGSNAATERAVNTTDSYSRSGACRSKQRRVAAV